MAKIMMCDVLATLESLEICIKRKYLWIELGFAVKPLQNDLYFASLIWCIFLVVENEHCFLLGHVESIDICFLFIQCELFITQKGMQMMTNEINRNRVVNRFQTKLRRSTSTTDPSAQNRRNIHFRRQILRLKYSKIHSTWYRVKS